jgi:hypothetical protein
MVIIGVKRRVSGAEDGGNAGRLCRSGRGCGERVERRFCGVDLGVSPGVVVEIFCSTWNSFDERQEDLEIWPPMFHVEHWRDFEM